MTKIAVGDLIDVRNVTSSPTLVRLRAASVGSCMAVVAGREIVKVGGLRLFIYSRGVAGVYILSVMYIVMGYIVGYIYLLRCRDEKRVKMCMQI